MSAKRTYTLHTYSTLVIGQQSIVFHCCSFGHAAVELTTRYTTADIVLEISSMSRSVK